MKSIMKFLKDVVSNRTFYGYMLAAILFKVGDVFKHFYVWTNVWEWRLETYYNEAIRWETHYWLLYRCKNYIFFGAGTTMMFIAVGIVLATTIFFVWKKSLKKEQL